MPVTRVRRHTPSARQRTLSFLMFFAAAGAYIAFGRPAAGIDTLRTSASTQPPAVPAMNAYGRSGQVHMRFALPGDVVDFPLEVPGDPTKLRYAWLPIRSGRATVPTSLADALVAPDQPGFYRLAVLSDSAFRVFDDLPLAVLVPFDKKAGSTLNGYKIGRYRGERRSSEQLPLGFLQIDAGDLDIPLTPHLQLADFVTHDGQDVWPRYAALDPRLLDKLELVFDALAHVATSLPGERVAVDVHSGFRTPLYNRRVARSASDSRHQYGDAADIAVDANHDGRVNARDAHLVAVAVEAVERDHPDLVGGLGVYTRNGSPYVHVDARGTRARWRG